VFSSFKGVQYRRQVLAPLYTLLYAYPPDTASIMRDFPNLTGAMTNCQREGFSVQKTALICAAHVLTDVLGAMPPDALSAMRVQLTNSDLRDFLPLISDIKSGRRTELPPGMTLGTLLVGVAMRMAVQMRDDRAVSQDDCQLFFSEVNGALSGKNFHERSVGRLDVLLTSRIESVGSPPEDQAVSREVSLGTPSLKQTIKERPAALDVVPVANPLPYRPTNKGTAFWGPNAGSFFINIVAGLIAALFLGWLFDIAGVEAFIERAVHAVLHGGGDLQ
jgi:hypothetical protein